MKLESIKVVTLSFADEEVAHPYALKTALRGLAIVERRAGMTLISCPSCVPAQEAEVYLRAIRDILYARGIVRVPL